MSLVGVFTFSSKEKGITDAWQLIYTIYLILNTVQFIKKNFFF